MFIDINKVVPHQLGNAKPSAEAQPASIAVMANEVFRHQVAQAGGQARTTLAGHSDFSWVQAQASILASAKGVPFDRVILESPRSESAVKQIASLSPTVVIVPAFGDYSTIEAQQRMLNGLSTMVGGLSMQGPMSRPTYEAGSEQLHAANKLTIDNLKNIDAKGYQLALIQNPTPFGALGRPMAHGDPASYNRYSEITLWNGNKQIGSKQGTEWIGLGADGLCFARLEYRIADSGWSIRYSALVKHCRSKNDWLNSNSWSRCPCGSLEEIVKSPRL